MIVEYDGATQVPAPVTTTTAAPTTPLGLTIEYFLAEKERYEKTKLLVHL